MATIVSIKKLCESGRPEWERHWGPADHKSGLGILRAASKRVTHRVEILDTHSKDGTVLVVSHHGGKGDQIPGAVHRKMKKLGFSHSVDRGPSSDIHVYADMHKINHGKMYSRSVRKTKKWMAKTYGEQS